MKNVPASLQLRRGMPAGGSRVVLAAAAGCLALALVALAGCTQPRPVAASQQVLTNPPEAWVRDPASAVPTAAATPSTTTAPSTTTPSVPAPAQDSFPPPPQPPEGYYSEDLLGAERAAMHFLNLYAYTFQTGNTAPLEAMSGPDCTYCQGIVDNARVYASEGKLVQGGDFQFNSMIAYAPKEGDEYPFYVVAAEFVQSGAEVRQGDRTIERTAPTPDELAIGVAFLGEGWQVVGVGHPEPEDG